MHFKKDLGPFIDKNLKLMYSLLLYRYNGKPLVLKQINPHFFFHILKILDINVRVYGKKLFEVLTFSVWTSSVINQPIIRIYTMNLVNFKKDLLIIWYW